jgi:arginyl-tRNA synthetase
MFAAIKKELATILRERIRERFGVDHEPVIELPPRRALGDIAFPAPLHLAKTVKQKPREIAAALLDGLPLPVGVRELRIEGAGYLNAFLDRPAVAARLLAGDLFAGVGEAAAAPPAKVVIEHTNINPNKAAHIGHLRNAVLGDVLARTLRRLGLPVEVQNYIDDTGVQVADVVVGFRDLLRMEPDEVAALPEPFDFFCWDLYARVGRWYEEDKSRQALRRETLHELEAGAGPRAEMGRLVARRIVHRHLATMARLGIGYDLLTRESEILRLHFFTHAFERLQRAGAVRLETEGKNSGCWVMPLTETPEFAGLEDPDKVIVRSDATVTYVGKDIAYQLWKFGLLGRDFHYRRWVEEGVWETAPHDGDTTPDRPRFGHAHRVINVIDARQSYLQKIVRAGLEALGHAEEARRSTHFAYEMVSLSAATARALGYVETAGEEAGGEGAAAAGAAAPAKTLEMSGRKGIGVKADDLLDQLVAKSREEIARRQEGADGAELDRLAREIAVAAVRFFMTKWTTTRVIAFDLDEALNFEGETGPYLQYALVRVKNIERKLEEAGRAVPTDAGALAAVGAAPWSDDLWDLVLAAAQVPEVVAKAGATLEVSLLSRHALELAQAFSTCYNRHPILREDDPALRTVRLAAVRVFALALSELAGVLGIPVPERM